MRESRVRLIFTARESFVRRRARELLGALWRKRVREFRNLFGFAETTWERERRVSTGFGWSAAGSSSSSFCLRYEIRAGSSSFAWKCSLLRKLFVGPYLKHGISQNSKLPDAKGSQINTRGMSLTVF